MPNKGRGHMFIKTGKPAKVITSDLNVIKNMMCDVCKLSKAHCIGCGVHRLQHITIETEASGNTFLDYGEALEEAYRNDN